MQKQGRTSLICRRIFTRDIRRQKQHRDALLLGKAAGFSSAGMAILPLTSIDNITLKLY
jgi:hypothetical protein